MHDATDSHDFISAFLRDSLRIGASAWIVTNVMRIWIGHGVPASAIVAALDDVAAEHPLDPERISTYRGAVIDLMSGRSQAAIPSQRAGEPETHEVSLHCRVCGESVLMDNDEAVLVGDIASFTATHAACPPVTVHTQMLLP